jgi:SAM-dependent methyltransferase
MTTRHFALPRRSAQREEYLIGHCAGKRVLHLGCADWSSSGDWLHRVESGAWLHGRLGAVAAELVGVDKAPAAVAELRDRFGLRDLYVADAERLDLPDARPFDVIVAGELIEHLGCPGAFLESAKPLLRPGALLLITTCNAYCLRRLLRVLFGAESVHEDHVAYYSHRTLARLAELHGYAVVEQLNYRLPNRHPRLPYLVEAAACALSPNVGEGIMIALRWPGAVASAPAGVV